jgi:triphosphoribosyl-dephospho-CoA synthetase
MDTQEMPGHFRAVLETAGRQDNTTSGSNPQFGALALDNYAEHLALIAKDQAFGCSPTVHLNGAAGHMLRDHAEKPRATAQAVNPGKVGLPGVSADLAEEERLTTREGIRGALARRTELHLSAYFPGACLKKRR